MDFLSFRTDVQNRFNAMSKGALFCTSVDKDEMWKTYLDSFPEGTNPVFRERTVHHCACCNQFIRTMGNVVAIKNGKLISIWDIETLEPAYQAVADAMSALIKSQPITDAFLHYADHAGTDKTFERKETGAVTTWEHFYVDIPHARNAGPNFFCKEADIPTKLSDVRALHDAFSRSLRDLSVEAVETVADLIDRGAFYRCDEHKFVVTEFLKVKRAFDAVPDAEKDFFVWTKMNDYHASVAKIRGTSIGTLLQDLSGGRSLDSAVGAFEAMVAPANYKRTTALVTQKQVDAAKKTIADLGLTSALDRRYAFLPDVKVSDILFVDRAARTIMKDDVFGSIATKTPAQVKTGEDIGIEDFIQSVVPRCESIEVFLDNAHTGNLVSLIAPADPKALNLFKWNNGFSWSYNGDMTDSVKEKVKKAGGNVTGDLCCRLAWYNTDDLDLHMYEPHMGRIFFGDKISARTGGQLDVDMNVASPVRDPVENIFYGDRRRMVNGEYRLIVNNYTKRESIDVGFEVEIDYLGTVYRFVYQKAVRQGESIEVCRMTYSHATGLGIRGALPTTQKSREAWGLKTQEFHPLNVLMLSPNHWGERGIGNKHYFFMLDGCRNDGQARGFYNEFLKEDLNKHRKVLEIVGSKMRTEQSAEQLSGLGFSSTQRNALLVRTKGAFNRTVKVNF